jgi:hypothetical protein
MLSSVASRYLGIKDRTNAEGIDNVNTAPGLPQVKRNLLNEYPKFYLLLDQFWR